MNRESDKHDGNERSEPEVSSSRSLSGRVDGSLSGPKAKDDALKADAGAVQNQQLIAELKRKLEETRLPAELKRQILEQLPSPEERERLFRALQEKGGISSDHFLKSLGLEVNPRS